MGTRNLTCVVKNGEYKVAQYGQWDGYLEGQGMTILNFLKNVDLESFNQFLENVSFLTNEEIATLDNTDWKATYPYLSRDYGGKILNEIMDREGNVKLVDDSEFGKDSLFCEYAYVVNLDDMTFEVYTGFVGEKDQQSNRFYLEKPDRGYYGCKLLKVFDLKNLPSEDEFLSFDMEEEE